MTNVNISSLGFIYISIYILHKFHSKSCNFWFFFTFPFLEGQHWGLNSGPCCLLSRWSTTLGHTPTFFYIGYFYLLLSIQGFELMFARQKLHLLSYSSSPFFSGYFRDMVSSFLRQRWTMILLIYASCCSWNDRCMAPYTVFFSTEMGSCIFFLWGRNLT
jgi:hypothetical protein